MKLLSINFNNFRRFKEETIEFNSGLNLLVGPNNAGKSTIIEAIGLAFNFSTKLGSIQLNKDERTGTCSFDIFFKFNRDEWRKALLLLPVNTRNGPNFPDMDSPELFEILTDVTVKLTWSASYTDGRRTSAKKTTSIVNLGELEPILVQQKPIISNAINRLATQNFARARAQRYF